MNLFDWIIFQTPQYKKLNNDYEYSLKRYNELFDKTKEIKRDIEKIKDLINRLDSRNIMVKGIKKCIEKLMF